jgi:hypothetical protein
MHARYYSHDAARFLSVDPVSGSVGSSQSWNRYSYVHGNPINLLDPDGRVVIPPRGRRSRIAKAFREYKATPTGRRALITLQKSPGIYDYNLTSSRPVSDVEKTRIELGQKVTRRAGHFDPNLVSVSKTDSEGNVAASFALDPNGGGTINVDFGVVDAAKDEPYSGDHGDVALIGHETGHAVAYEEAANRQDYVDQPQEKLEADADAHRDKVLLDVVSFDERDGK